MVRKSKLTSAFIHIRCDGNNHNHHNTKRSCLKIRDAIFKKFINVRQIQTVYPDENEDRFCVIGTFTIFSRDRKKLERALYNTTTKYRGKTIKIDKVEVSVAQ